MPRRKKTAAFHAYFSKRAVFPLCPDAVDGFRQFQASAFHGTRVASVWCDPAKSLGASGLTRSHPTPVFANPGEHRQPNSTRIFNPSGRSPFTMAFCWASRETIVRPCRQREIDGRADGRRRQYMFNAPRTRCGGCGILSEAAAATCLSRRPFSCGGVPARYVITHPPPFHYPFRVIKQPHRHQPWPRTRTSPRHA